MGRVIEVIGEGYLGKSDIKRCEDEKRKVSGDPVGSTDPEGILWGPQILRCLRISHPFTFEACKTPYICNPGV